MYKKKLIQLLYFIIIMADFSFALAQTKQPIKFSSNALIAPVDTIKLDIENRSPTRTYYYSIVLQGYLNNAWDPILSDIDFLGQNEVVALKPIKPNRKVKKRVSLKEVFFLYGRHGYSKFRFGVMYYENRVFELRGKGGIVYLPPILPN